jgi:hypothetical protein
LPLNEMERLLSGLIAFDRLAKAPARQPRRR